jgi:hypothetical protein
MMTIKTRVREKLTAPQCPHDDWNAVFSSPLDFIPDFSSEEERKKNKTKTNRRRKNFVVKREREQIRKKERETRQKKKTKKEDSFVIVIKNCDTKHTFLFSTQY